MYVNLLPQSHLVDIMKYFSVTLNLRVSANGIRGRYTAEQLASLLDEFIEKFALCTVCRHPRIQLVISKGNLSRSCAGCGAVTPVPPHKLTTFITNQLQQKKQEKKKQNKKGPKADENQDNDAEDFFIGAMQGNPLTSNMF